MERDQLFVVRKTSYNCLYQINIVIRYYNSYIIRYNIYNQNPNHRLYFPKLMQAIQNFGRRNVNILIHQQPLYKIDKLFSNAISNSKSQYILRLVLHAVKLLLLTIFMYVDQVKLRTQQSLIVFFLGLGIGVVGLNFAVSAAIIYYAYSDKYDNNLYFTKLAQLFQHCVLQQPFPLTSLHALQQCTSQLVYNATNGTLINDEGLTPEIQRRYQMPITGAIQLKVMKDHIYLSFIESNGKLLSVGLIIVGIVALCGSEPSAAEKGVVITLLILQALNVLLIIAILIFIAFLPIIICLYCFYICCCSRSARPASLPEPVSATASIVEKTDGSCIICFQAFDIGSQEKVIVLPCSEKHVFHQECIKRWTRVSGTCPVCRKGVDGEEQD